MKKIAGMLLAVCLLVVPFSAYGSSYTVLPDYYENHGIMKAQVGEKLDLAEKMYFSVASYDRDGDKEDSGEFSPVTRPVWTSDDPGVATVDQSGNAVAVKKGYATISATYGNKYAENIKHVFRIWVSEAKEEEPAKKIGSLFTLNEKRRINVQALLFPGVEDSVKWSSDRPEYATVSETGVVFGESSGKCRITGEHTQSDGTVRKRSVTVKVVSEFYRTTNPITVAMSEGDSFDIVKVLYPNYKGPAKYVTCSSNDSAVASAGADGQVKAKAIGECKVTVAYFADMNDREEERQIVRIVVQ